MSESLSSSKRRFIENWRQNVSVHMESGNICRVTISEMTPEPTTKASAEHIKTVSDIANILDDNPALPTVKFSYHHGIQSDSRKRGTKLNDRKYDVIGNKTFLPPSPNGCVIQNGIDYNISRSSSSVLKSVENTGSPYKNHLVATTPMERRSSKTAREFYEKYNMKSKTNNYLMTKPRSSGFEQFTMPWRNKTFLSLPLRFTGNMHRSNTMLSRQKTFASDFSRDDISDIDDDGQDW